MPETTKINCPKCGASMNHHAVKIEYGLDEPANPDFGGVLKNVYTCPKCGDIEMTDA
jgi:ribosomal protein S27AE